MTGIDARTLREAALSTPTRTAMLLGADGAIALTDAARGTSLSGRRSELVGKSVLVATRSQLASALALFELDGVAARLIICPPDFGQDRLCSAIAQAGVDAIVCDDPARDLGDAKPLYFVSTTLTEDPSERPLRVETEWIMPTSGTTGAPKLVAHSLAGLLGAIAPSAPHANPIVWATFYDIRRYGGLQIFLRAVSTGATLTLGDAAETLVSHLGRCRAAGVTHMSGTPSHWRRLMMSGYAAMIAPDYIRLSGEVADRAILEALKSAYPLARIAHAYASTEAGVGFEVNDGLEGFPASVLTESRDVELRIVDGSLRIRSARTATRYIGRDDLALADADGFIDTDDMVEQRGDRFYFKGRRAGVINVGGLKVHPEEVEQIINQHDAVSMSLVKARRNPILGDVIVANVVLKASSDAPAALKDDILSACRARLDRHKVPAIVTFVPSLEIGESGKLARSHA